MTKTRKVKKGSGPGQKVIYILKRQNNKPAEKPTENLENNTVESAGSAGMDNQNVLVLLLLIAIAIIISNFIK